MKGSTIVTTSVGVFAGMAVSYIVGRRGLPPWQAILIGWLAGIVCAAAALILYALT